MSEQINAYRTMYRPSRRRSRGMNAGGKRLLYLAGFGGLAIMAGVAVYGLTGRSGGDNVPVVQADQRPIRVKPENPGGMAVAPEQKQADPNNSRLAPGTEEPNPQALLTIQGPIKPTGQSAPFAPSRVKTFSVQLSAAKSEADAQAAWDKLAKKMPDLIGQHRALFQKTSEAGAMPWRLRTGGFSDSVQAKAFCEKVKAKGGQCALVES
jgi:cell division septation protein DedD